LNNPSNKPVVFRIPRHPASQDLSLLIGRNEELDEIKRFLKIIDRNKPGVLMVSGTSDVWESIILLKGLSGINRVLTETEVLEDTSSAFNAIINTLKFLFNHSVVRHRFFHICIMPEYLNDIVSICKTKKFKPCVKFALNSTRLNQMLSLKNL
jgi:hypothetical protein